MKNNLSKKEVSFVPTKELNYRFCRLLQKSENMPANIITYADMKEVLRIEDELKRRLIKSIGHDFYPPDRIEKKYPSNYMISLVKPKQEEPKEETKGNLRFKITIKSSIGSIVKQINVKVDSKSDADIKAGKMIEELGLKKATYKIS